MTTELKPPEGEMITGGKIVKVLFDNRGEGEIHGNNPPNHDKIDVRIKRGIIYKIFHPNEQ